MKYLHLWSVATAAALLTACGGGDSGPGFAFLPGVATTPTTGTLVEPQATVTTLTKAQIDAGTKASGLQALSGAAKCDVKVVALNYTTLGAKNEPTNASGVLLLPAGSCADAAAPLVAYAKGTDLEKPRTLANPADTETQLLTAMYAAQGYAVVATDYLGYAKSKYPFHPYLHADSEARSVLDAIRAARVAITSLQGNLSGKVMFTGYSQGGHSSMAAHRAAERDFPLEFNVVAGAHLAGPYNLSGAVKLGIAPLGYQYFVPFQVTSYQKVYGDVYAKVGDAFKAPYDGYIENLLPSPTLNSTTLVTSGALPGANGESPSQVRDLLFQPAFVSDTQTNSANPFYLDAKKNDLLGWSPRAATLLCGGAGDPTVPPAVHQAAMKADFDARGVKTVISVDVDPQIQSNYGPGGVAPTDPTSAAFATYYGSYHGTYEPPFCHAAARKLFDVLR
ncbi:lipase family protein [Variovorax humicola]|uniref:Lipase family protein n=1 Tax=Variovorax humicola TaxID=1769758 RepID=A0ABU8WD27_9BURK